MQRKTIRENRDFQRSYSKGKNFVNPLLVTYLLKNKKGVLRYGITTSKKIGPAVKRNRARRLIREAFFHLEKELPAGYDLVFVARLKTTFVKQQSVEAAMRQQLVKAGLLPLPKTGEGLSDG